MDADEAEVDPAVFAHFANTLLVWHRAAQHAVVLALSEGFVATVLALADRAGVEVLWSRHGSEPNRSLTDVQVGPASPAAVDIEARTDALRAKSRELDGFMAR